MSDHTDEISERAHDAERMGAGTCHPPVISAANVVGDPSYALVRVLVAMPHVRLRNAIASALESTHDTGTRETRVAGLPRRGAALPVTA